MLHISCEIPDTPAITALAAASPEAMVYHLPAYAAFLHAAVGGEEKVVAAWNGQTLIGLLRYFRRENEQYGVVYNSSPWFGSHGGCLIHPDAPPETRDILLSAFVAAMNAEGRLLCSCASLSPWEYVHRETYTRHLAPCIEEVRTAQIVHLPMGNEHIEENLFGIMHSKTRNIVRKALQQEFTLAVESHDDAWNFLRNTHEENMRAIGGTPKRPEHFAALRKYLGAFIRLCVARLHGQPVAAMLLLCHGQWVEYFVPVIKAEFRSRQPMSFLIFRAMLDAVAEGRRFWNFGGTRPEQRSLHHFKAGWGAQDHAYGYVIHASPRGRKQFSEHLDTLLAAMPGYYLFPKDIRRKLYEA